VTPRSSLIEDESDSGGLRPGAGAAPVPKAGPPRRKPGYSDPAASFRRAKRGVTQRRINRRRIPTTGRGDARAQAAPSFAAEARKLLRASLPSAPDVDRLLSQPPTTGRDSARPAGAEERNTDAIAGAPGCAGDAPDVSAEFRSEFAALLAFYAARIAAARRGLPASEVAAAVQAILNEQAIALRTLSERRHAATQKQRDEKPERPAGAAQRKDDGPKPS
jgi:hypothetical protein